MRVHLRNVVYSALERGVVMGQHRVGRLSKHKQKNADVVVDTLLKSIWESLDGIIDFRDEDHDEGSDERQQRSRIGFQSTDAVADTTLPSEREFEDVDDDDDDDDDDVGIVPLDVLHRVHRK